MKFLKIEKNIKFLRIKITSNKVGLFTIKIIKRVLFLIKKCNKNMKIKKFHQNLKLEKLLTQKKYLFKI